jgi:hypothetical protein
VKLVIKHLRIKPEIASEGINSGERIRIIQSMEPSKVPGKSPEQPLACRMTDSRKYFVATVFIPTTNPSSVIEAN